MNQHGQATPRAGMSRRAILHGAAGLGAGVGALAVPRWPASARQATPKGTPGATPAASPVAMPLAAPTPADMTATDIAVNGITLRVTQLGTGEPVLFCHGFPDTSRTWWRHMAAVADAGYRAIAPDMRGYGGSSAPDDPLLYTPFDTVGDMVGLLDALGLPTAVIVGHDWGGDVALQAAMMRPDRFTAVMGLAGAYTPRGDVNPFDQLRAAGLGDTFYVFQQIRPEADAQWADAAQSIPSALYWASGLPPAGTGWDPYDPAKGILRPAPVAGGCPSPTPITWPTTSLSSSAPGSMARSTTTGPGTPSSPARRRSRERPSGSRRTSSSADLTACSRGCRRRSTSSGPACPA